MWTEHEHELLELLLTKDPREFLRWDVIKRTMFVDSTSYIKKEYSYLKKNNWNSWKKAIRETKVGYPARYLLYPRSSENLIHHAYHLARFQDQIGERITDANFVFEFGGGYGSMCRLIHKMGFKGKYAIFDLPAFSALQVYFLKSVGLNAGLGLKANSDGINCICKKDQIETLLRTRRKKSIFLGTWSISETPVYERNSILNSVVSFDFFLIAYQKSFGEVDNVTFFNNWMKGLKNIEWCQSEILHIPNNYYIFGKKM
jgi:hypothetical protein